MNIQVAPSIARFRQLLAQKKLQLASDSPSANSDDCTNTNDGSTKKRNTNANHSHGDTENMHPNRLLGRARLSTKHDDSLAMVGNHLDETRDSFVTAYTPTRMADDHDTSNTIGDIDNDCIIDSQYDDEDMPFSPLFTKVSDKSMHEFLSGDLFSPVANNPKGVQWADTPAASDMKQSKQFRKTPMMERRDLNESVVVSDDDESMDSNVERHDANLEEMYPDLLQNGTTTTTTASIEQQDNHAWLQESVNSFESPPSIRESLAFEEDSLETAEETEEESQEGQVMSEEEKGVGVMAPADLISDPVDTATSQDANMNSNNNTTSPTKAALNQRVKFLTTEVRFADQTCVELSTKLKSEKAKSGIYQHDLSNAKRDHVRLSQQHQVLLQENTKLKVLMQTQKEQTAMQLKEYQAKLALVEEGHKTHLEEWEKRHQSHLKHAQEQISLLNDRLAQSLQVNASLQNKLDHSSSQHSSQHSSSSNNKDIQSDIQHWKHRVQTAELSATQADATVQAIQARLNDLQSMYDRRHDELQRERNEKEMMEQDRDNLLSKYQEIHRQLAEYQEELVDEDLWTEDGSSMLPEYLEEIQFTPVKDTTCNLLARTLRSEQKRRNEALDSTRTLQNQILNLENVLSEFKIDYEELKADNGLMEEEFKEKCCLVEEMKVELKQKEMVIGRLLEEMELMNGSSEAVERSYASFSNGGSQGSMTRDTEGNSSVSASSGSQGLMTRDTGGNSSVSTSNSAKQTTWMEMHSTIDDLEGRLEVTQAALESTEEELIVTRRKLEETETLSEEMAGRLEEAEEELAVAEEQMMEYEEQFAIVNKELNDLTKELAETKDFSEFQARTIGTMKLDLANNETRINEFSIQLKSSLQALMKVEKILRTYEDSDDLAKKKLGEQSRKIVRLEETIKAINEHLSAKDVETASTQTTHTHLLAQSPMANLSSVALDSPASALSGDHYYQGKLSELRKDLTDANARCDDMERERDDMTGKMKEALRCLDEFRGEMRQQEKEHMEETASLRDEMDAISAKKKELAERCGKLESKLANMSKELSSQKAQSEALATSQNESSRQMAVVIGNNSELLTENENLRAEIDSLEMELENSKSLLKASNEEREGYQNDIKATKAAFECLQTDSVLTKNSLKSLEQEVAKLRMLLAQKEEELKEKSTALETTQELVASDRVKFDENQQILKGQHEEEIKAMQAAIHNSELQLAEIQQVCNASNEALQNASDRIKVLENMMETKEQECDLYKAESEDLSALLEKKRDELLSVQNNLAGAEEELDEERATTQEQRREIDQLNSKIEEDKLCMSAYEESVVGLKREIHGLQCEISDLQHELEDTVESYQSIVYENQNQINMLQSACENRQVLFDEQIAKAKQERDITTKDFNSMIQMLKTQLHSKDEAVAEAKAVLSRKEQHINEMEAKIRELMSIISDLEEDLNDQTTAQAQLEEEISRKQGQIETLQNSLVEAGDEIASTTEKLYALEITHAELTQSKAALQRELESQQMDVERLKTLHQDDQSSSNALIKDLEGEIDDLHSKKKAAEESAKAIGEELKNVNEKL